MNRPIPRKARRSQRGIALIELAVILPVILLLLTVPLFVGRVCWHYTAAQKAAHDAARYMSEVPLNDMKNSARAGFAAALARDIAEAELSDLNPGPSPMSVLIQCDGISCDGLSTPTTVRAVVRVAMFDNVFPAFTAGLVGDDGLLLTADVSMRYVAN
jgi:Tfp pilus assembly protein PilW